MEGQIGHEPTIQEYVKALVECCRELKRVLAKDGVFPLNLGDTYYSAKGRPHGRDKKNPGRQWARETLREVDGPGLGLPRKSLIGIPWRVALALQDDGWTLRSDAVWNRPGALPEPTARDRPWLTHEHVFVLARSTRYWFNRETLAGDEGLWRIAPRPDTPDAHFAPFPSALAEKCIECRCPPSGTVLDPFVGSGATMTAALRLNRNLVGIELKEEYCQFILQRIEELEETQQSSLLTPRLVALTVG